MPTPRLILNQELSDPWQRSMYNYLAIRTTGLVAQLTQGDGEWLHWYTIDTWSGIDITKVPKPHPIWIDV